MKQRLVGAVTSERTREDQRGPRERNQRESQDGVWQSYSVRKRRGRLTGGLRPGSTDEGVREAVGREREQEGYTPGLEGTQLQFIKWEKKTALDHVVDFKTLVRRCNEVDMPVNAGQQVTMFINSIRDQDGAAWKGRIRGTLRQHPTMTVNQVYDDFVAEFRGKKQSGGNTHNAKRQRWDKPVWDKNGQPLCFRCGEYGHMAKDCPKQKNDGKREAGQNEVHFIPEGLRDLYGPDGKPNGGTVF
ncbi:hypothetical protein DL765_007750 [Monosporascus sp. GIB2]|nr:hypothetical protein DL765_007750 [Monosporascus sp. GIB2]